MKQRIPWLVIIAAGVLVWVFALGQNVARGQPPGPSSPDTSWIETHVVAQNPDTAATTVKAPDSVGSNAAILAAQILLAPIDFGLHIPLILR